MTPHLTSAAKTILAVLAGGTSARMGCDKASLPMGATTLLAHLAGVGQAAGLAVLVCGRLRPLDWPVAGVEFLPDAAPGEGPLRGLEAALTRGHEVLLIAGDLPEVTPADVRWLLAQPSARDGVATIIEGQLQPLFSRYSQACRPLVSAELRAGRRSPLAVLRAGDFSRAEPAADLAIRLRDVDTPADWQRATAQWQGLR